MTVDTEMIARLRARPVADWHSAEIGAAVEMIDQLRIDLNVMTILAHARSKRADHIEAAARSVSLINLEGTDAAQYARRVYALRAALADADREPRPTDGPDYHADHAAWRTRNRALADPDGDATTEGDTDG